MLIIYLFFFNYTDDYTDTFEYPVSGPVSLFFVYSNTSISTTASSGGESPPGKT